VVNFTPDLNETLSEDIDWIYLLQDGGLWWALVNTAMNIGFHKMWGFLD
jgi:hypothetical protein